MDSRKPLDGTAIAIMVALCALWSLQQISLKAVAGLATPMLMIGLRSVIAAALVSLLMWRRGEWISLASGRWRPGLIAGSLFALEYVGVGEALRHTHASHVVVFLYTSPIFAALGLHWLLPAERLTLPQWAGIGLAFAGIVLTFADRGGSAAGLDAAAILYGDLLALAGGACWGATTVVLRASSLNQAPATEMLLYQLLGAAVLLLALVGISGLHGGAVIFSPTPTVLGHLFFQAVIVSFASFLVWNWLLRRYLASRLGVLSFMTPLFGIAFGMLLLGEPLEHSFLAGSGLVLCGVLLVSAPGKAAKPARDTSAPGGRPLPAAGGTGPRD